MGILYVKEEPLTSHVTFKSYLSLTHENFLASGMAKVGHG